MSHAITVSLAERPDLAERIRPVSKEVWPPFVLHDNVAMQHAPALRDKYPEFQLVVIDPDSDTVLGTAHSVPFEWDGLEGSLPEGWDDVLLNGVACDKPTALSALSIAILPQHRRKGLSYLCIAAFRKLARSNGLEHYVAPVRPMFKARYPLAPIERYIHWRNKDGSTYDPWIRVHLSVGGRVLKPCPASMRVVATIDRWQEWTELIFPDSGMYVVEHALVPVDIDIEGNIGRYVEPNVWIKHSLETGP